MEVEAQEVEVQVVINPVVVVPVAEASAQHPRPAAQKPPWTDNADARRPSLRRARFGARADRLREIPVPCTCYPQTGPTAVRAPERHPHGRTTPTHGGPDCGAPGSGRAQAGCVKLMPCTCYPQTRPTAVRASERHPHGRTTPTHGGPPTDA